MMKSDLISRQDAVNTIKRYKHRLEGRGQTYGFLLEEFEHRVPSAEAVSMEEHIKELNDLAVEWKAKFAKAETITDEIYDETMAKVAKECEECKERLRNIRQSAEAVHGEWIFNPTDAIDLMFAKPKCSKCGFESSDGGNFCPNCGARMENTK